MNNEFRYLLPAWLGCALLPLPVIVFWQSGGGRSVALALFFIGCVSLAAYAFRRDIRSPSSDTGGHPEYTWPQRMVTTGIALFMAFVIFSVLCLALNDAHDLVAVFLAFLILIPALCVTPYLTLATRKPFAAVVFTLFLVLSMKLLGGIVVVLVYGWHASEHGHTDMPWTRPNLLVWLFWLNAAVLCLSFYLLGARRFRVLYGHTV